MDVTVSPHPFVTVEITEDPLDVAIVHTFSNHWDSPHPYQIVGWHIRAPRRCQFSVALLEGASKEHYLEWDPGVRIVLNADNGRFIWREVDRDPFMHVVTGEMPD